jgi:type III secretory pathway component EscS
MSITPIRAARPSDIRTYGTTVVVILVLIIVRHPPVGVVGAMTGLAVALARGFAQVQRTARRVPLDR